jgi:uncharacterized protein YgiM (DUF1202 family)
MRIVKLFLLIMVWGLWGCATGTVAPTAMPPREDIKVYYYVAAQELNLKSAPSDDSPDIGKVRFNERVEKVERGPAGWFLVRSGDGRQGWISEQYLTVKPASEPVPVEQVVIRPVRRRPARPVKETTEKVTIKTEEPEPSGSSLLTPSPAEAAPPPAQQLPTKPKARPEMFEPF